ncbi:MAG: DUF6340 family protein [Cytophagaceae bacterium]|nr:DUF6340 family protein [Cytophagaceae bacterium]
MKSKPYFKWMHWVLLLLALSACRKTIYMSVLKPAPLTVPSSVRKLVVVNRSLPSEKNKVKNVLEGIITGEGLWADKEASSDALMGFGDALRQTDRFQVTQPGDLNLRGTGTNAFPQPLSWEEVEEICNQQGADAIVSLEVFDSNTFTRNYQRTEQRKRSDGSTYTEVVHFSESNVTVNLGWRLYDVKRKVIIDEYRASSNHLFTSQGNTLSQAIGRAMAKRDMLKQVGAMGGRHYGARISPTWITVSRYIYKKGSQDLKLAKKRAKYNDWEGAAEIWQGIIASDPKNAGKACYNMALYHEGINT